MPDYDYEPPVSQLLTLGERPLRKREPHDYRAMGITEEHLAEISRMSRDPAFQSKRIVDGPETYAPMHAMRAMIQIGTEPTIAPLARLLQYNADTDYDDMNDWFMEEIPEALSKMGAVAIPRCVELLRDASKHTHSRLAAAQALEKIANKYPHTRPECLAALAEQLERYAENEPEWNGWLAAMLVDLKGVEAASLIERAYAADMVDETIQGDWDEVQVLLGLRGRLSDDELAAKAKKRRAAHGWLSPDEMLSDTELIEEMMEGFIDEDKPADDLRNDELIDEPPDRQEPPGMHLPEDVFTADQRRELAALRKKERKAAEQARQREKQQKRRR